MRPLWFSGALAHAISAVPAPRNQLKSLLKQAEAPASALLSRAVRLDMADSWAYVGH